MEKHLKDIDKNEWLVIALAGLSVLIQAILIYISSQH